MSTISTHLNWGASYIVDDVYRRFIAPDREERDYVLVARLSTVVLIVLSSAVGLWLENAMQAFQIMLQIGAGTGLVFLLRWFWWRINAWSEIVAMISSFLVAIYFQFVHTRLGFEAWDASLTLVVGVGITTVAWVVATFLSPPVDRATLQEFYDRIRPLGPGWDGAVDTSAAEASPSGESLTAAFMSWFLGCVLVYGALFGTGYLLYGETAPGVVSLAVAGLAGWGVLRLLPRVGFSS